jgi:mono/diheme cytochrome c family protein
MDAQGPLSTGGKIPAVANLTSSHYVEMPVGTMFHSITYGKGNMGSYASQLSRKQRWMVIQYVKSQQLGTSDAAGVEWADSTATKDSGIDTTSKK